MSTLAERVERARLIRRTLVRGGSKRIYRWPACPPEAPHPAYHAHDLTTGESARFPTLASANEWLDQCPLMRALPFEEEQ